MCDYSPRLGMVQFGIGVVSGKGRAGDGADGKEGQQGGTEDASAQSTVPPTWAKS